MIAALAFCPHPPMLVPDLAAGAAAELAPLRAAAIRAVASVASAGRAVVLLGAAATEGEYGPGTRSDLGPWGVPVPVDLGGAPGEPDWTLPRLPLSLAVGAWLREQALGAERPVLGVAATVDTPRDRVRQAVAEFAGGRDVALVVLGDGSARRSRTAPGYLDERAASFDDAVTAALASGDPSALAALDPGLGAELLASGVPAWRLAADLLEGRPHDARVTWTGDPYGVAYTVAEWTAT